MVNDEKHKVRTHLYTYFRNTQAQCYYKKMFFNGKYGTLDISRIATTPYSARDARIVYVRTTRGNVFRLCER